MNVLTALRLAKIVSFQQAEFKFTPGLHAVFGRNLNRREPEASNGSGKSVLLSALPNAMFDTSSFITKGTRSIHKGIFRKGGAIEFDFVPHGTKTKCTYRKTPSKASLSENGMDVESRLPRDSLRARIDMSEAEFFSTVYIDSRRPNSFLLGTPADRFAYITSQFRLNDIDEMRRMFNRKIADLREKSSESTVLTSEYNQTRTELDALPPVSSDQITKMQESLRRAQEDSQRAARALHSHDAYTRFLAARRAYDAIQAPRMPLEAAKRAKNAWIRYSADVAAGKEAAQRRAALIKERDDLGVDQWVSWYDDMTARRDEIRRSALRSEAPEKVEAPGQFAAKAFEKRKAINVRISQLRGQITERKEALAAFEEHFHADGSECPTCHQVIGGKLRASIKAGLTESLATLRAELEKFTKHQQQAELFEAYQEYQKELASYRKYRKLSEGLDVYPFKDVQRHMAITSTLEHLAVATPVAPKAPPLDAIEKILEQHEKKQRARDLLNNMGTPDKPEFGPQQAEALRTKANETVARLMTILPKLQAKLEIRRQCAAKLKRLGEQIQECKRATIDLPVYEMLQDAYSPQGIKLLIIKSIANTLQKNLNRFAKQVYDGENFTFEVDVDANKFDVLVTRKNGKQLEVCDIRDLSGAESRLFVLVFLLALLPMIPARRRLNVLILDEPGIGMDDAALERFRTKLLPALLKIVPTVVVVTPNVEDVPTWAKVRTVVKKGFVSTLIEGRYDAGGLRTGEDGRTRLRVALAKKNNRAATVKHDRAQAA